MNKRETFNFIKGYSLEQAKARRLPATKLSLRNIHMTALLLDIEDLEGHRESECVCNRETGDGEEHLEPGKEFLDFVDLPNEDVAVVNTSWDVYGNKVIAVGVLSTALWDELKSTFNSALYG